MTTASVARRAPVQERSRQTVTRILDALHRRGYLETPLGSGILRGALDGSVDFNGGKPQVTNGLSAVPDPVW